MQNEDKDISHKGNGIRKDLQAKISMQVGAPGEKQKAGVARRESMEAGFALHRIPNSKPRASDRAAGSEAGKAG